MKLQIDGTRNAHRRSRFLFVLMAFSIALSILSSCEYNPVIVQFDPEKSAKGITVLSALNSNVLQGLGIYGNVLWRLDDRVVDDLVLGLDVEILENGDMLLDSFNDELILFRPPVSVVWVIPTPESHHCMLQMPNGNIMYLLNYYINVEGYDLPLQADAIREVNPLTLETIWEWRGGDHLSTEDYCPYHILSVVGSSIPSYDWTHSNTIVYQEEESAVYLNIRNLDRIVKIDYPSGEILWSMGQGGDFGEGLFYHAHDPEFLENGNILIFDNGNHREPVEFSRAVEIAYDPDAGWATEVWQWPPEPWFFDAAMGDANRIANGNTLITSSHHGIVYEVTPAGEIVWQLYLDPKPPYPGFAPIPLYKAERLLPPYPKGLASLFGEL